MKAKKKRGRPSIPAEKRLITFTVRLSQEEHDSYQETANGLGIPLSGWIRMTLRKEAAKHESPIRPAAPRRPNPVRE